MFLYILWSNYNYGYNKRYDRIEFFLNVLMTPMSLLLDILLLPLELIGIIAYKIKERICK